MAIALLSVGLPNQQRPSRQQREGIMSGHRLIVSLSSALVAIFRGGAHRHGGTCSK